MKKCPFCAEDIQDAAIKCRYCGEMLESGAPTAPSAEGFDAGSRVMRSALIDGSGSALAKDDFDATFELVNRFLAAGDFTKARQRLEELEKKISERVAAQPTLLPRLREVESALKRLDGHRGPGGKSQTAPGGAPGSISPARIGLALAAVLLIAVFAYSVATNPTRVVGAYLDAVIAGEKSDSFCTYDCSRESIEVYVVTAYRVVSKSGRIVSVDITFRSQGETDIHQTKRFTVDGLGKISEID